MRESEMQMETTLDNIEKSRNTQAQLSWYETRSQAIDGLPVAPHRLVDMMPVFSTRQAVTRFLETYDYWNLIRDIPATSSSAAWRAAIS